MCVHAHFGARNKYVHTHISMLSFSRQHVCAHTFRRDKNMCTHFGVSFSDHFGPGCACVRVCVCTCVRVCVCACVTVESNTHAQYYARMHPPFFLFSLCRATGVTRQPTKPPNPPTHLPTRQTHPPTRQRAHPPTHPPKTHPLNHPPTHLAHTLQHQHTNTPQKMALKLSKDKPLNPKQQKTALKLSKDKPLSLDDVAAMQGFSLSLSL